MEPILKVSGLTKTFSRQGQADFTAVKNISCDLFLSRIHIYSGAGAVPVSDAGAGECRKKGAGRVSGAAPVSYTHLCSIHGFPVKFQVFLVKLLPHSLVLNTWLNQQNKAKNNKGLTTK